MIKIKICIIPVMVFVMITGMLCPQPVSAGLNDVFKKSLPAIELKDMKLRGTAKSGLFKPIAIVENTSSKETFWYEIGDTLCGGRIVDIDRGIVILEMNNTKYAFGLPEGEVWTVDFIPPEDGRPITLGEKVGDNTWKLELNSAIEMLSRINSIMKEARMRPYFAIGKAAGLRIDRIDNESIIRKMGLEDGDVIKGVNGFGLMTPTRLFGAYRKYKNESLIQLQLIRNDSPVTLTYNILR